MKELRTPKQEVEIMKVYKARFPCFSCELLEIGKIYTAKTIRPTIRCRSNYFNLWTRPITAPDFCKHYYKNER